ncbi:proteasome adapter and scaffold protein ECM29-like [Saccoglossus kowalevskii]
MAALGGKGLINVYLIGFPPGFYALRVPSLVAKDIGMVQQFFDAMCKEDKDTRLHVQEALSMMSPALKNLEGPNLKLMEALIMSNIENNEAQARVIAVQYAISVFPPSHIPSRYALLLATGDVKEDVHSEATKALRNPSKPEDGNIKDWKPFPSFTELTEYIQDKSSQRLKSQSRYVVGTTSLPFNPTTYNEVLLYMRMCLAHDSGLSLESDLSNPTIEHAPAISQYVTKLLKTSKDHSAIQTYIDMTTKLLATSHGHVSMYCLLEIIAVASGKLASQIVDKLEWIKGLMHSSREEMRENASHLFAVVACTMESERLLQVIKELTKNVSSNKTLEMQHGSLLALGYLIGRYLYQRKSGITVDDMETDLEDSVVSEQLNETIGDAVRVITGMFESSQAMLNGGACLAIGEIGRNGRLSLPPGEEENDDVSEGNQKKRAKKKESPVKELSMLSVVDTLSQKIQSSKEPHQVKEKACTALGYLPVGDPEFPHTRKLIHGLLDSTKERQVNLQFSVGEALNFAALGSSSSAARDMWTVEEAEFSVKDIGKADEMEWVLDIVLRRYVTNEVPHVRQASCIWLLSLVKRSGAHPAIQNKLKEIQMAFMNMLTENDEFTQDAASKVRQAADSALRTLSRVSIRLCDINNGKIGEQAIGLVLPILLKELTSKVEEVRSIWYVSSLM